MNSRTLWPQEELDYTPDLITLEDEAGQEHQCEVIDTVDHNGEHYLAVVPYVEDPEKCWKRTRS